jgi:hypothetical protein
MSREMWQYRFNLNFFNVSYNILEGNTLLRRCRLISTAFQYHLFPKSENALRENEVGSFEVTAM